MRTSLFMSIAWVAPILLFSCRLAISEDRISFNRDIRPILSDKCFYCHGPDAANRKADLRLDVRDVAVAAGAINPETPDASELLRRIVSPDADVQMPPPAAKLGRLSEQDTATLRQWIAQGARYEGHWSFIAPQRMVVNHGESSSTIALIDNAVEKALAVRGLSMQPEAERHSLIRRLSFDLTGLPPTPAEVESFLGDTAADAVERLIDRLLGSPHYGERMAVDWLDAARYADSFGFQVDREREMWPWRDWVIRAFNENLPFDQFITWQLAGDLLPNATSEQILATAFNRLHQQEAEGGSVEEEYRVEYVSDRVQTVATTFLGLTFECARCHDHKFDPILQKEYYQLFALFQNIDEAGLYSYFTHSPPTPTLTLTDASSQKALLALQQKVSDLEQRSKNLKTSRQGVFDEWLARARLKNEPPLGVDEPAAAQNNDSGPVRVSQPIAALVLPELGRFPFETLDGNKLANSVSADQPATLSGENHLVAGKSGNAVEFTGDDPVNLPFGNFLREEPFSISLWLKASLRTDRAVVFHRSRAWTDAASRGYELLIEDGRIKWSLIHFWPGNAASIAAVRPLPLNEWVHVVVSSDGSSRAAGLKLVVNGQPISVEVIKDHLTREITGGGGDNIAIGERFRDRGFRGGLVDDFRVFNRQLSPLEALSTFDEAAAQAQLHRPTDQLDEETRAVLFEHYLAACDSEWVAHLNSLQAARAELAVIHDGLKEIMVMRELPQPKKAYVLFRGEYAERREEVTAGTPAALLPFPADAPKNRLGFASWLTDPQHPLTARVTVNRVWQSLFGRGLVRTSEDFGSQGARPLYPEVLDALAVQLIDSGWNMKQLVRTIVLTDTYRQRSISDAKTMTDDPDNEWLARGPRFRLPAEMIRDNALVAAGLLKPAIGGPPVNPYEMTESFKPTSVTPGDGAYRRSLYTNWRRTGPPPAMVAFDAPRRAVCIAKRERTDSPLQALILLNGVQYVEAARVLGETLTREAAGDLQKLIEQASLRCLSRKPDDREIDILTQLYNEQLNHFDAHPADAALLLAIGQTPRDTHIDAAAAAAATVLVQALLNHDECVVLR